MKQLTNFDRQQLLAALAEHGVPAGSHALDLRGDCVVQVTTEIEMNDTSGFIVLVSSHKGEYWTKPEWLTPLQADVRFFESRD